MIANAVLYTFSTIAQTLAGAIALLGAFVLYRLQSLAQAIEDESQAIAGTYNVTVEGYDASHQEAIRRLHDGQNYRGVLAFVATTPPPPAVYQATRERTHLLAHLDQKDALLKAFRVSLVLTVGLVVASVAALALTPAIVTWCPSAWLGTGVIWFTACMLSYGVLIRKALE